MVRGLGGGGGVGGGGEGWCNLGEISWIEGWGIFRKYGVSKSKNNDFGHFHQKWPPYQVQGDKTEKNVKIAPPNGWSKKLHMTSERMRE